MITNSLETYLNKQSLILSLLDHDHFIEFFDCGRDDQMNSWLSRYARKWHDERLCTVWILSNISSPGTPIGFFTLSAHQAALNSIPKGLRADCESNRDWIHNLLAPFPATLLGKFALDKEYQGKGYGNTLMLCAYARHLEAATHSSSKFLILDTQSKNLMEYYNRQFGFLATSDSNGMHRMVKSTKAIETELAKALSPNPVNLI